MGPPEDLVIALQRRMSLKEFIETGTFRGDTAAWAVGHFDQVTTIELSPVYHSAAQTRFHSIGSMRILLGQSSEVLRSIVPGLSHRTLFWLDAHWSGADTAGIEAECPLLAEINLINSSLLEHVVMVDDARLFCTPPPPPHKAEHWPSMAETIAALVDGGRRYVFLFEDVFVAVPQLEKPFLIDWLQKSTGSRPAKSNRPWWKLLG